MKVNWLAAAMLAMALSVDSLAVGLVYGARGIRLPARGLLIVSLTSAAVLAAAMLAGEAAAVGLGARWARGAGAALLVAVGAWAAWQAWRPAAAWPGAPGTPAASAPAGGAPVPLLHWRIPSLRLVVTILREPAAADVDRSGSISGGEALLLGLALAADSLGAGLGAGMAGFSPLRLPLLVGLAGWLSLHAGSRLAARLPLGRHGRWGVLHGLVLVALGLTRLVGPW